VKKKTRNENDHSEDKMKAIKLKAGKRGECFNDCCEPCLLLPEKPANHNVMLKRGFALPFTASK
jgi:hypothetical protein